MSTPIAPSACAYVLGVELPDAGPVFETTRGAGTTGVVDFSAAQQAIVVGGQLAEFTPAVKPELRTVIADGMLLAQLAANKAAGESGDVFQWYDKYVELLQNIGWHIQDFQFQQQAVGDQDLNVHEAIIPVIAALLGPQVAAVSLVRSVLEGLQGMSESRPWITLFDKSSQHAHGAKFQVAYVDADTMGQPHIALLCFGIRASRTITQVLFLKFADDRAEVRKAEGRLSVSLARLESAKDALAQRVAPFVNDFVKNIDI